MLLEQAHDDGFSSLSVFKGGRELGSRGKLGGILQLDADWSMMLGNDRDGGVPHLRVNGDRKQEWGVSLVGFIR